MNALRKKSMTMLLLEVWQCLMSNLLEAAMFTKAPVRKNTAPVVVTVLGHSFHNGARILGLMSVSDVIYYEDYLVV